MREAPGCWGDGELLILDEGCSSQLHSMACRINAWHHGPGRMPFLTPWSGYVGQRKEPLPTYCQSCVVLCCVSVITPEWTSPEL